VPSVNKIEGRVAKPCAGRNVVNFEDNIRWWAPCRNRGYIGTSENRTMTGCITLHLPISSAANLT
jgi:hypothetical protein